MFSLWLTLDLTPSCALLFVFCTLVYRRKYNTPDKRRLFFLILSLRAADEEGGSRGLRIRGKGRWERSEQGGGLLESPAVNLQTASQSGNDVRQESSNLTAQLHLVIALRFISLSPISIALTYCIFRLSPAFSPLFHVNGFSISVF